MLSRHGYNSIILCLRVRTPRTMMRYEYGAKTLAIIYTVVKFVRAQRP